MDARFSPKTDQRAGVRPISFLLDNMGSLGDPVTLPIRPEDLTRNEPSRTTVYQTLGRGGAQGWADDFGEGLPQVTISGHTGWNYKPALGQDGFQAFEALNELVAHRYHEFRQIAIDSGQNPAGVKLLFVDLLDDFAWHVAPMSFVLRRSKSRPLLYQYNITLQALNTSIDGGLQMFMPPGINISGGLGALGGAIGRLAGLFNSARAFIGRLQGLSSSVLNYVNKAVGVLKTAQGVVGQVNGFIDGATGQVIGIAKSVSMVGRELFRTVSGIAGIGASAKAAFSRISAAFNEVVCIFSNALRPGRTFEQYEGLYGASNCSSTTGGRMPSAFADSNVFAVMNNSSPSPVTVSGSAIASMTAIQKSDQVLRPMPQAELGRHLDTITGGLGVVA